MANVMKGLLENRSKAVSAARAILDNAASEGRSTLTTEERADYDKYLEQSRALCQQIEDEQNLSEAAGVPNFVSRAAQDVGLKFVTKDGKEVRALRKNEAIHTRESDATGPALSLTRALRGMVLGDWSGAAAEQRVMSMQSGASGGWLVPTALSSQVIDLARSQSVVMNAGALTLPMQTSELTIVKLASDPQGHWRDENTSIPASDATFTPLHLKAMSLACRTVMSLELFEDAVMLSQTVENAIAQALALELDRSALLGTGVSEPRGLHNTPGVNELSLGANGAALAGYGKFSEAVELVANANGLAKTVVMAPRTQGTLDRLSDTNGQPLQPFPSWNGLQKLVSTQVPVDLTQGTATKCSAAYVGDFSQMLIGMRSQLVLEASRVGDDAFEKMQVVIRAYLRADVAVLRPTHFTVIKGIKA